MLHVAFWLVFNVLQYARYITLNYGDISLGFYLVVSVQILLNLITFYGSYFIVFDRVVDFSKVKSSALLASYLLVNIITSKEGRILSPHPSCRLTSIGAIITGHGTRTTIPSHSRPQHLQRPHRTRGDADRLAQLQP